MEELLKELINKDDWGAVNLPEVFANIRKEMEQNYRNYKLYLLLGKYYEHKNINQAWLCYENAEFYCDDQKKLEIIRQHKKNAQKHPDWCVNPSAIVLLSYNQLDMTKQCLESIRKHNPRSAYEIIIVDNASEPNVREWLKELEDIKLILNEENKGFPMGCNQGIKIAEPESDIFLLNNDTVMMPNSLFWLRMGLYEDAKVGAVGSRSNHAVNYQRIEETYDSLEEYESYAIKNNLPMLHPYEEKNWLQGFALLLKRQALDAVGLLDIRFSPGNYEDNDLGYRLKKGGFSVRLCYNSFIFHYGNGGGQNVRVWSPVVKRNHKKFEEKWGFSEENYRNKRKNTISLIKHEKTSPIKVLDVNCGLGASLATIKHMWPNAQVYGIELNEKIAEMASLTFDVIQGNLEHMSFPYEKEMFDYIIFGDILENLYDPQKVLSRLLPYLKADGRYLCSISNVMHAKVLTNLVTGKFEYEDTGILDRRHIRFFTLDSFCKMVAACGMETEQVMNLCLKLSQEEETLVQYLSDFAEKSVDPARFYVYKYFIQIKKRTIN